MLSNLRVSTKLVGVIAAVALAATVAVGWFVTRSAERALRAQAIARLEAERASRARLVTGYFEQVHKELLVAPKLLVTQIALRDMPRAIPRRDAGSPADYDRLHALFHPVARGKIEAFGYHDVFLVGVDGTVLYSCVKEIDFATNLRTGRLRDSGLATAFARAAAATAGSVQFVDYAPYEPSSGSAAFIGTPVFDTATNARLGVVIYQLSAGEIDAIMSDVTGFGDSGETYLLGSDLLLRTNRRGDRGALLRRTIDTAAVRRALANTTGSIEQESDRGVKVLSSFAPISIEGVHWAILAEANLEDALAPARQFRSQLAMLLMVVALVSGVVLWEAMRRIVLAPVSALAAGARRVAGRDYTDPVRLNNRDELGLLGQSFNGMMAAVGAQVDELKRAHQLAERGQRLLEAAPDAMVVANASGQIVIVNAATERLFGYQRDELIGRPIEVLVPDAAAGRHVARRDGYLARPTTRAMGNGFELWGRRKDGSLVPVEISLSPLDDPDGLLAVAAVRDISERRTAQKSLNESEERLAAAASGANLGLWDVEPTDGRTLTNPIFESQLGYAPLALRETDEKWAPLRGGLAGWVELLHPEDRRHVEEQIRRYLAGELDVYRAEHRVRAADGTHKWILSVGSAAERDEGGRPLRVNGVHIDITEMKGLQLDLQLRYEELQRLQQLRDGLVHMIVHDLRSPLTSVMGYIDLLRTDTAASTEDRTMFIDTAYTGASQMVEMISSLLDVNRLEAGEMPVDRQEVDLCAVAADAVRSLGGLTIGRNVTQVAPEGPVLCSCDPALVRRVIGNLLGNALKFTPESGAIAVTVSRVNGLPQVEVSDTGPGIPADFLGRVFDKFSQGGEGRAAKRYSSGLGLAFCKLAVEAHGGQVGVSSKVGAGSRFWFRLPRHNAEA